MVGPTTPNGRAAVVQLMLFVFVPAGVTRGFVGLGELTVPPAFRHAWANVYVPGRMDAPVVCVVIPIGATGAPTKSLLSLSANTSTSIVPPVLIWQSVRTTRSVAPSVIRFPSASYS